MSTVELAARELHRQSYRDHIHYGGDTEAACWAGSAAHQDYFRDHARDVLAVITVEPVLAVTPPSLGDQLLAWVNEHYQFDPHRPLTREDVRHVLAGLLALTTGDPT